MRDMRIETAEAAGGQWGSCHRYIAAVQSLLLAAKVIRLSIDIDIFHWSADVTRHTRRILNVQCRTCKAGGQAGRQGSSVFVFATTNPVN